MYLVSKNEMKDFIKLKTLGPEPEDLTFDYLKEKYKKKTIAIKSTLLDQSIFVGLGNIYADEVLFLTKINPLKKTNQLTEDEIKKIIKNTKIVLKKATELGGSTIKTYMPEEGVAGRFQNQLLVHNRQNQKCLNCDSIILKTKVGGRGTYYCPNCQK